MCTAGVGGVQGPPEPPAPQTCPVPFPDQHFQDLQAVQLLGPQSLHSPPLSQRQGDPGTRWFCQSPQAGGKAQILQEAD